MSSFGRKIPHVPFRNLRIPCGDGLMGAITTACYLSQGRIARNSEALPGLSQTCVRRANVIDYLSGNAALGTGYVDRGADAQDAAMVLRPERRTLCERA